MSRYDATQTNESTRSARIFKDLNLDFQQNSATKDIQKIISSKNIMYPVDKNAMPEKMSQLDVPNKLGAKELDTEKLISEWLKASID